MTITVAGPSIVSLLRTAPVAFLAGAFDLPIGALDGQSGAVAVLAHW